MLKCDKYTLRNSVKWLYSSEFPMYAIVPRVNCLLNWRKVGNVRKRSTLWVNSE